MSPAIASGTDGMALPVDNRAGPYCGVTAVAIAAGVSFERAWTALSIAHGVTRPCEPWKGEATRLTCGIALEYLGIKYRQIPLPKKRMTLVRFVYDRAVPGKRYLVFTTRHAQLVKDHLVVDQQGSAHIAAHGGRSKFVTDVIEIEEKVRP
jgi:hypothetical protein